MGSGGQTVPDGSTAKVKVALLNLGQSADWTLAGGYVSNNNAADLGDFYQWGRVADGHQNTVWSKNTSHVNQVLPYGTTPANTSDKIDYNISNPPVYDNQTHQVVASSGYYGKFIINNLAIYGRDWYCNSGSYDNGLWGTAKGKGRSNQGSLNFNWDKPANNPCPSGWRIPSIWNWWDIAGGNGSDNYPNANVTTIEDIAINNTWQIRSVSNNNTVYGGTIVTNSANEKIFLSDAGYRGVYDHYFGNSLTFYISSTASNVSNGICLLVIYKNGYSGYTETNKIEGQCARCFKEP
jgi:hypothetical protein